MNKYLVKLTEEEREKLERIAAGNHGEQNVPAWKVVRARVLLRCDHGAFGPQWSDQRLAAAFDLSVRCIEKWRQRAVEEGPLAALERRPRRTPPVPAKLDSAGEAQLARSVPPSGQPRWTLQLLVEHLVQMGVVESISRETVRQVLRKRAIDLGAASSERTLHFARRRAASPVPATG